MAEPLNRRRWMGRLTFVFVGLLLILSHLIPLETVPPSMGGQSIQPIEAITAITEGGEPLADEIVDDPVRWIAPDFLVLMALAWVARRPSFAPALAIAGIFLLADLLLQRPPGLWAGLMLILSEIIRGRAQSIRTLPFWLEWATVAVGIVVITIIYRFTLSMVLVPQASLGLTLLQMGLTILAYPAVVFVSYIVFGVSRPAPGEVDEFGHRI